MRRRRRGLIEFVPENDLVAESRPPVPAMTAAPDWYRKMTPFVPVEERMHPKLRLRRDVTLKGCPGVGDYLSLGYVLPLWADFVITATETGFGYDSSSTSPPLDQFPPKLWDGFPRQAGDHEFVLKMTAPWRLRTPRGWSVLLLPPWYHHQPQWSLMPGVVDSDRCGVLSPIMVWHLPVGEPALIKAGTPLVHVVPFKRSARLVLSSNRNDPLYGDLVAQDQVFGQRLVPGSYREARREHVE
jgi:hypothetical protein